MTYDLELPSDVPRCSGARFAELGMGGDGATFRLELNEEPVFEQYVANAEADRRWHQVLVDLSKFAGRRVLLSLWAGPGPSRILRAPGGTREEVAVVRES